MDLTDDDTVPDKQAVRTQKAEVSRQLLELADTLALAESLVRNEYWYYKGRGVDIVIEVDND
jgi:hypothetical protein